MMIPANEVRIAMNRYGMEGTPFLFAVDFELSEGLCIANPLHRKEVLFVTPLGGNKPEEYKVPFDYTPKLSVSPLSPEEYEARFGIVMEGLMRGNSFLTNLTVKTPVATELSLEQIFCLSNSPYQLYIPNRFVCFSPERFVCINKGVISTNPMKGTINASIPNAEEVILNDSKETAEHYTIVDLLRNDLGIVSEEVEVKRFRYIDKIRTNEREILQVSSEIAGKLGANYHSRIGDILFRLLPAGSISGAPKRATVDIIRKAEKESRGFYTGVFGYFDGEQLDSAVLIRYIEEENGQKYFRSGGGITVASNLKGEYIEVLEKIYLPFI